jgi:acyl-CoA synthetase (AMP-forming)/AMP-acid ligase II
VAAIKAARATLTIPTLLEEAAARAPGRVYLTGPGGDLTFGDLHQRVARLARGLAALGVRASDRVAVLLPSHPAYLETWLALARLGALLVPINALFKPDEIAYVLVHSEATVLVTADALYEAGVAPIRARCPALSRTVTLEGRTPGATPFPALLETAAPGSPPAGADADTAAILYTSGTTGLSKGACLSHRHYVLGGRMIRDVLRASAEDRFLCALPLFHVGGQIALVMASLASTASLVLLPEFRATTFWEEVRRWRPTIFHGVGTILAILDRLVPSAAEREHTLRVILSAGHPELVATMSARLGIPIVQNWGMTEGGMTATRLEGGDPPGSIGRPVGPNELRLVDEDDRDVAPEVVGEIVMRGPLLLTAYWRDPAATAQAMRGGWFHTGDLARRDAAGYFYFVDRKKDMVRRGGENVSSQEVEHVLRAHPAVAEAAVLGVPDPVWGEEVKAFIVLRENESERSTPPESLRAFCADRLALFKVPRHIEYRAELPRTASHRVRKALLRKEGQP